MKELKWITVTEYVDGETGEVITKHKAQTEYYIIRTIKKIKRNEIYGTVTRTNECKRKPKQGELFD